MIIIKTKQGDIMVRDGAFDSITHNHETRTVTIKWTKQASGIIFADPIIEHVVSVVYINDQTGEERNDDGLQVQELQKRLSDAHLEVGWMREWTDSIDHSVTEFVRSIRNVLAMNAELLPKELCDSMFAIVNKAYDNTKSRLYNHGRQEYYEQWKEKHLANSWAEADITAHLHDTIEEQAAVIRELKTENERLELNERIRQSTATPATKMGNTPPRRPWWRRWFRK